MSKPEYRVVVTTSDHYLPALRPLAWLMHKYWVPRPDVVVGGFREPDFDLPSNWEFISLGRMADYPVDKWSDAVIKLLNSIEDDVFVFLLEDMWPVRHVNTPALDMLCRYMRQFEYVARIDLTVDRLYAHGMRDYGSVSWIDLIQSMPGSAYHMSFMAGMWRQRHLLSVLVPGETPWDIEIHGTPRLSHNRDVIVLGTRQFPVRHCLALRGGQGGTLASDQPLAFSKMADPVDIKALWEEGLLEPWREDVKRMVEEGVVEIEL